MYKILILLFLPFFLFGQTEEQLLVNLRSAQGDSSRVLACLSLSQFYSPTNFDRSIDYALDALIYAKRFNNQQLLVNANNYLGIIFMSQGNYGLSANYFKNALSVALDEENILERFSMQFNLASLAVKMGDFQYAKEILTDSDSLLIKFKNEYNGDAETAWSDRLMSLKLNIGLLFLDMKEYEESAHRLQEILEDGDLKKNSFYNPNSVYFGLGKSFVGLKKWKEAEGYYMLGLKESLLEEDERFAMIFYHELAKYYCNNGQYDQALKYAEEGRAKAVSSTNLLNISNFDFQMGKIAAAQGKYLESLDFLRRGYQIAKEIDAISLQQTFVEEMSNLFLKTGRRDSSMFYAQMDADLNERINEKEAIKSITEAALNLKFKERENRILDEQRKELQQFSKRYYFLFSVLILLISLGFAYNYWTSRTFKAKEDQMEEEKKQIETELKIKDKQLVQNTLQNIQESHIIKEALSDQPKQKYAQIIDKIKINKSRNQSFWEEYEIRFSELYSPFFNALIKRHPNLTPNEKRLSTFIHLELSTKEISNITGQSVSSIKMARVRLRKKLGLSYTDKTILDYFMEIRES